MSGKPIELKTAKILGIAEQNFDTSKYRTHSTSASGSFEYEVELKATTETIKFSPPAVFTLADIELQVSSVTLMDFVVYVDVILATVDGPEISMSLYGESFAELAEKFQGLTKNVGQHRAPPAE